MKSLKKYQKKTLLENAHDMARGLHSAGIMDITTMREFDVLCLPSVKKLSSKQIRKIRLRERVSQSVFAKYLNISASTIKQWEQGEKHPKGPSLKLLNIVADKGLKALT